MHPRHLLLVNLLLPAIVAAQGTVAPSAATAELRALHEKVLRAHRERDVEMLLEDESADYVVASRGEITRPTIQERRERLGAYLKASTFSEYRDLMEPSISVSTDSTLAWVLVQVTAHGKQKATSGEEVPIAFTSAWIELYEKRAGKWLRTGNVSNFKP